MDIKFQEFFKVLLKKLFSFFNTNTIRNIFYVCAGILVFITGVIIYGIILNLREIPLSAAMKEKGIKKIDNANIIIDRSTYSLLLYDDTVLVKTYKANFGQNIRKPKSKADDESTPVGVYKICEIDTGGKYHKFFRLNYPNLNDASEALRKGLITQNEFDKLKFEFYYSGCTDDKTVLGGDIGIQGIGRYNYFFKNLPFVYNWTDGSVAVSNEDIDELYTVVKKGTKVVIK